VSSNPVWPPHCLQPRPWCKGLRRLRDSVRPGREAEPLNREGARVFGGRMYARAAGQCCQRAGRGGVRSVRREGVSGHRRIKPGQAPELHAARRGAERGSANITSREAVQPVLRRSLRLNRRAASEMERWGARDALDDQLLHLLGSDGRRAISGRLCVRDHDLLQGSRSRQRIRSELLLGADAVLRWNGRRRHSEHRREVRIAVRQSAN
jgi:hypothetical protein